jgi:hypothetical protein
MPRYAFWFDDDNSIVWTMPGPPSVGEVVSFGKPRGSWKVTGRRDRDATNVAANLGVTEATPEDGERINDPLHPDEWAGRKYKIHLHDCPNCQPPLVLLPIALYRALDRLKSVQLSDLRGEIRDVATGQPDAKFAFIGNDGNYRCDWCGATNRA